MCWIPCTLHRDFGDGVVDVAEIVSAQFDLSRSNILLKSMQLCGSGDGNYPRLLSQEPGKRDLSRRSVLAHGDVGKQTDHSLIGLPSLRRKAGNDVAEIAAVECCVLGD